MSKIIAPNLLYSCLFRIKPLYLRKTYEGITHRLSTVNDYQYDYENDKVFFRRRAPSRCCRTVLSSRQSDAEDRRKAISLCRYKGGTSWRRESGHCAARRLYLLRADRRRGFRATQPESSLRPYFPHRTVTSYRFAGSLSGYRLGGIPDTVGHGGGRHGTLPETCRREQGADL